MSLLKRIAQNLQGTAESFPDEPQVDPTKVYNVNFSNQQRGGRYTEDWFVIVNSLKEAKARGRTMSPSSEADFEDIRVTLTGADPLDEYTLELLADLSPEEKRTLLNVGEVMYSAGT